MEWRTRFQERTRTAEILFDESGFSGRNTTKEEIHFNDHTEGGGFESSFTASSSCASVAMVLLQSSSFVL